MGAREERSPAAGISVSMKDGSGVEELKEAIKYAKIRNVKTYLTLNILIKNDELNRALELVEYV